MITKNKTALITGATSGFGELIAKHLVNKGYSLIVLGRAKEKLDSLLQSLKEVKPDLKIEQVICDLSSLKSIVNACETVCKLEVEIELLILNAGLWNFEFCETEDGIEETLQVNLLAPVFLLQRLSKLIPHHGNSKVIFTSSGLHQGLINFSDIEMRKNFSGFKSYRQSKLGLILLTRLFAKQENYSGIAFCAVHPGMVNTKLGRNAGWFSKFIFKLFGKSKEKGAETHNFLIDQSAKDLTSGAYYANSKITKTTKESYNLNTADKLLKLIQAYFDSKIK